MKTTARILRSSALSATFILVFLTFKSYGAHLLIGFKYGYSSALTEVRYDKYNLDYTAPKLKACRSISIGIVSENHLSLIGEAFVQKFDEVNHYISNVGDATSGSYGTDFLYIGLSLEYRFFKDIARSWNPYITVGAFALFYLDLFGGGPPEYPKAGCVKAAMGTRIRVAGPLYLNPQVAYFSGSSSVSFQAGLDVIF
jgi:hypothetical protein